MKIIMDHSQLLLAHDGHRYKVRNLLMLVPVPGDRVGQWPDGSTQLLAAVDETPAGTTTFPVTDHLLGVQAIKDDGVALWAYLDTTRDAIREIVLAVYPQPVTPRRVLSLAERRAALIVPMDKPSGSLCAWVGCSRMAIDACSVDFCETRTCARHTVLCEVGPGMALGYCPRCAYFLLPERDQTVAAMMTEPMA